MRHAALLLTLLGSVPETASAQVMCGKPVQLRAPAIIGVDLTTARFAADLPFDEPFIIKGSFPNDLEEIHLTYGRARWITSGTSGSYEFDGSSAQRSFVKKGVFTASDFAFNVDPLEPDAEYLFRFGRSATPDASNYVDVVAKPRSSLASHLHTDFGVMRSLGPAQYWGATSAVHFYLRPVNRNENSCAQRGDPSRILKHISAFAGFSVLRIHSEVDVNAPYSVGSPIIGLGLRGLPHMGPVRVNGGILFFEQQDANPLINRNRAKRDLFVSVTADLDLKSLLGPLFGAIIK